MTLAELGEVLGDYRGRPINANSPVAGRPGIGYPGPPSPAGLRLAYRAQLVDLEALREPGEAGESDGDAAAVDGGGA